MATSRRMDYQWHDFLGNVGVAMIVLTYLWVQLGRMDARGLPYSLSNLIGAGLLLVSLAYDFNLSSVVVEAFWAAISLIGIGRWWLGRRSPAQQHQLGAEARAHGEQ